jgi:hypothetical protein
MKDDRCPTITFSKFFENARHEGGVRQMAGASSSRWSATNERWIQGDAVGAQEVCAPHIAHVQTPPPLNP